MSTQSSIKANVCCWIFKLILFETHTVYAHIKIIPNSILTVTSWHLLCSQNASTVRVTDGSSAATQFRQGWGRRTEATTDHGPAQRNAAVILHIDLSVVSCLHFCQWEVRLGGGGGGAGHICCKQKRLVTSLSSPYPWKTATTTTNNNNKNKQQEQDQEQEWQEQQQTTTTWELHLIHIERRRGEGCSF